MTYPIPEGRIKFLTEFFSYMRPHLSRGESKFINRYIYPVMRKHDGYVDECGNIHIDLRGDQTQHRTLFTAHVDSVHRVSGRQHVVIKFTKKGEAMMQLSFRSPQANCLGADDAAGVLILLNLIAHGVPAYYLFTRGEERGGIGAKHVADNDPDLLSEFDRAVAFDRRGTSSVITYQGFGMCASDDFANALGDALATDDMMYAPDDTGVYTDTAEFTDIIPECTNISVGYYSEHSKQERLDIMHLERLLAQTPLIIWDALPVVRAAGDDGYKWGTHGASWAADDEDWYVHSGTETWEQYLDRRYGPIAGKKTSPLPAPRSYTDYYKMGKGATHKTPPYSPGPLTIPTVARHKREEMDVGDIDDMDDSYLWERAQDVAAQDYNQMAYEAVSEAERNDIGKLMLMLAVLANPSDHRLAMRLLQMTNITPTHLRDAKVALNNAAREGDTKAAMYELLSTALIQPATDTEDQLPQ